jgi:hypothetical protein
MQKHLGTELTWAEEGALMILAVGSDPIAARDDRLAPAYDDRLKATGSSVMALPPR